MEYVTKDGWIVTEEMYNQIKALCPSLVFDEIMRLVDIMKSDQIHK
jgi:hypothetical protein